MYLHSSVRLDPYTGDGILVRNLRIHFYLTSHNVQFTQHPLTCHALPCRLTCLLRTRLPWPLGHTHVQGQIFRTFSSSPSSLQPCVRSLVTFPSSEIWGFHSITSGCFFSKHLPFSPTLQAEEVSGFLHSSPCLPTYSINTVTDPKHRFPRHLPNEQHLPLDPPSGYPLVTAATQCPAAPGLPDWG